MRPACLALLCAHAALALAQPAPAPWPVHGANRQRAATSLAVGPGSLTLDFSTPVSSVLNNYPTKVSVGNVGGTEVAFFGDNDGGLTAYNMTLGKVWWRYRTPLALLGLYSQPAVNPTLGHVYWGQYDGLMRALNFDGSLAWSVGPPPGACPYAYCSIDGSPALSDDGLTLYFSFAEPATFLAVDARTGGYLFTYTVQNSARSASAAASAQEGGAQTRAEGSLLQGERLAAAQQQAPLGFNYPLTLTSPAISTTHAYFGTQATIFAFSTRALALDWTVQCGLGGASNAGPYGFAVSDASSSLFTACFDASTNFIVALDTATGRQKWRTSVDSKNPDSDYAYTSSRVALGPGNRVIHIGYSAVYAFDGATGAQLWRLPVPLTAGMTLQNNNMQPSLGADGVLYVSLKGNGVWVVDSLRGTKITSWAQSDMKLQDDYLTESIAIAPASSASGGRPRLVLGIRQNSGSSVVVLSGSPYVRPPLLSAAAIAGIVVGSLAAVAAVAVACWVYFQPTWLPRPPCLKPKAGGAAEQQTLLAPAAGAAPVGSSFYPPPPPSPTPQRYSAL